MFLRIESAMAETSNKFSRQTGPQGWHKRLPPDLRPAPGAGRRDRATAAGPPPVTTTARPGPGPSGSVRLSVPFTVAGDHDGTTGTGQGPTASVRLL
jgi:hypothetical protein